MHPHSAAAYLRAMSIFGFGSLLFLIHTMTWWVTETETAVGGASDLVRLAVTGPVGCDKECLLRWYWLSFSIIMGIMKLPFRMSTLAALSGVQRQTTREESRVQLKCVVKSWKFGMHRALGRVAQISAVVGLGIVIMLGDTGGDDVSKKAALDASCANLLVAVLRLVLAVGVLYTHEVRQRRRLQRLRNARQRRGLLEREMEALRKETFESMGDSIEDLEAAGRGEASNNSRSSTGLGARPTCSICLERFVRGDRLWVLPCDDRHKFHSECIKEWLTKNESCPLCTRSVRGEVRDSELLLERESTSPPPPVSQNTLES